MSTYDTNSRPGRPARLACAVLVSVVVVSLAGAAENDAVAGIGWVSADPIIGLVDDDHLNVEINIGPALLRMIAAGAGEDPELRELIQGIDGIRAVVLDTSARGSEPVDRVVRDLTARLEREGWERTARVRDGSSNVNVLIRVDDEGRARGLVVVVLEKESNELVFVNLHGVLDLERLSRLEGLDVPGLDHISGSEDAPPTERRED